MLIYQHNMQMHNEYSTLKYKYNSLKLQKYILYRCDYLFHQLFQIKM